MKRIIFTVLFLFLFTSSVYADLSLALKQTGEDIFAMAKDNKEEYICSGQEIINEDGKVSIEINCCNCKDECVTITIPTKKTGM